MSNLCRIAFIGAGDISLIHAEAIQRCPKAQLAGLWSISPELTNEKAQLFGCIIYDSAEAIVSDPEVDAVFVLTNMETHAHYAQLAMNAGKHVLIEKPVAASITELESLAETSRANEVCLMPGHNYIYESGLQRTRGLLETGKLGDLVALYIHYHIHHPEEVAKRYPGVIRHLLTHHSYIMTYLAGAPAAVSAMSAVVHYEEFEEEDLAMVNIRMQSGGLAHFCASFAADDNSADPWTFIVKTIGTEGASRFSYRDWVENKPGPVHSHTYSAYTEGICNEVDFFVNRCLANGEAPLSTIEDAITCQKIIEACETSIDERREVDI